MAFKVHYGEPEMGSYFTATKRLALTHGGTLVPDTDVRAQSLYCTPGKQIPMDEAIRYGLVEPEVKEADAPETKEIKPQATKARKAKAKAKR